jgi:predicted N-acetyltransferase YhbS
MSTQTEMAPESVAAEKPARGETTYTVQMFEPRAVDGEGSLWRDIATVTVPPKSPRRKVIGLALAQSGLRPAQDSEPLRVRVLDAASSAETVVAPFQPEPEWRVGS